MDLNRISFRNSVVSGIGSTIGATTSIGIYHVGAHLDNKPRPPSVSGMPEVENVTNTHSIHAQDVTALGDTSYEKLTERLCVLVEEMETTLPRVSAMKDRHTQNTGFLKHLKSLRLKEFSDMRSKVTEMDIVQREISECKQEIGHFRSILESVDISYVMAERVNKDLSETEKNLQRRLERLLKREREKGVAAGVVTEYRSVRQRFLETQTELERLKRMKEWNHNFYNRLTAMADNADNGDNIGDSTRCLAAVRDKCKQTPVGPYSWTEGSHVPCGNLDPKTEKQTSRRMDVSIPDVIHTTNASRTSCSLPPSHVTQAVSPPFGRHDPKPPPERKEKNEGRFRRFIRRLKKSFF